MLQDCTGKPPFSHLNATELYYQIVFTKSACMHFAWSMEAYPTLYAAYTADSKLCTCNASSNNYNDSLNQNERKFTIPGLDSDFSMAVIFKGLFEFNATKSNAAAEALNLTVACNPDLYADNVSCSYLGLNDDRLMWTFHPSNKTFEGVYDLPGNYTNTTKQLKQSRFSIRVSAFCGIVYFFVAVSVGGA